MNKDNIGSLNQTNVSKDKLKTYSHNVLLGTNIFEVAVLYGQKIDNTFVFLDKRWFKPNYRIVARINDEYPETYSKLSVSKIDRSGSSIFFNHDLTKTIKVPDYTEDSEFEKRIDTLYKKYMRKKINLEFLRKNPTEAVDQGIYLL